MKWGRKRKESQWGNYSMQNRIQSKCVYLCRHVKRVKKQPGGKCLGLINQSWKHVLQHFFQQSCLEKEKIKKTLENIRVLYGFRTEVKWMQARITWIGQEKDSNMFGCKIRVGPNLESYCAGKLLEEMLKMVTKSPHRCWSLAILLTNVVLK